MAVPAAVHSRTKTLTLSNPAMSPLQPVQRVSVDTRVGRLTGVRVGVCVCTYKSLSFFCACATHAFKVSVSVVQSIMQPLTLCLTPEPSLSLPLKMHPFPSPECLSPPSSHKPTDSMLHARQIRKRCSMFDIEASKPKVVRTEGFKDANANSVSSVSSLSF